MKLPRDWSGRQLASKLSVLGYEVGRQTGSHMRLTTARAGEHHITIVDDDPLKIGTLGKILREVAEHHGMDRDELLKLLDA